MSGRAEQARRARATSQAVGLVKAVDGRALVETLDWISNVLPYMEAWSEGLKLRHDPKNPASFIARATLDSQIASGQRLLKAHGFVEITPSVRGIRERT